MKYFKDNNDDVYAYDEETQKKLIKKAIDNKWEDVTDDFPFEENVSEENEILNEIITLEATVTPRRLRDAILTDEGESWLLDVENQIEALRGQL